MLRSITRCVLFVAAIAGSCALVAGPKPVVLDSDYQHDRFNTQPKNIVREFRAYTTNIAGEDGVVWGIPAWVAYEVKRFDGDCVPTKKRPSWFSDNELVEQGIAPRDNSYRYTRNWRQSHPDWYVRGHLAMKFLAERLGHDAAWNTHTMLNAVPQRSKFNSGIWQELEMLTGAWAQRYGAVWVITGPIVIDGDPSGRIGEEGEFLVAIPDALFKIVVKDSDDPGRPDVLAFVYPQYESRYYGQAPYPHQRYLTSVDAIEAVTGLDFLTDLPSDVEAEIEAGHPIWLWEVEDEEFLGACRRG